MSERIVNGVIPRFFREPMYRSETLLLTVNDGISSGVLTSFEITKREPHMAAPDSALIRCEHEAIQIMFDDLWALGYRPSEKFSESFKTNMEHVKDLRIQSERLNDLLLRVIK